MKHIFFLPLIKLMYMYKKTHKLKRSYVINMRKNYPSLYLLLSLVVLLLLLDTTYLLLPLGCLLLHLHGLLLRPPSHLLDKTHKVTAIHGMNPYVSVCDHNHKYFTIPRLLRFSVDIKPVCRHVVKVCKIVNIDEL